MICPMNGPVKRSESHDFLRSGRGGRIVGTNDMTTDDTYFERGINLRHGFLTEY